jgi:thiol:disulfide interchange protein DsbD
MLLLATAAGCGPLPAGAPPAGPVRRQAAGGSEESRPSTARAEPGSGATSVDGTPTDETPSAPAVVPADDYEAALVRAEAEGKPVLLLFTAPWCEYSRRLEEEVLTQAGPRAVTGEFVCVRVDFGRRDLREQYRVKVFPTIIPATSRGTSSQRLTGEQTVESYVAGLTTALTAMTAQRSAVETAGRR